MARDYYREITDRIVAQLEAGDVGAWRKPWAAAIGAGGMPRNAVSKREYRGINRIVLAFAGYSDPRWMTYRQAQTIGAKVRKGSKATTAVFWKRTEWVGENRETGEDEKRSGIVLRVFSLFNAEQCDGIEPLADLPAPAVPTIEAARALFDGCGAIVGHGGDRAYYSPSLDRIQLPPLAAFKSEPDYWSTRAHETIHWTGHETRCARAFGKRFGSEAYAVEELVAEMGAAFLSARLGLPGDLQHPEYLASWLRVLKSDARALFTAAAQAEKACDWIVKAAGLEETSGEETSEERDAA